MKSAFEVNTVHCDYYSQESLLSAIMSMEQLDKVCDTFFDNINKEINERKEKLINLQSRINRILKILSIIKNKNQILTFKSLRYYPNKEDHISQSIFYNEIFNQNYNKESISNESNKKKKNTELGSKPNGSMEDIFSMSEIYGSTDHFRNYTEDYKVIMNENKITPELNVFNSAFQFDNRQVIIDSDLIEKKETDEIQDENKGKKIKKRKLKLQDAPISIRERDKIEEIEFDSKKKMMEKFKPNIDIDIPMTINLDNIATIIPTNITTKTNEGISQSVDISDTYSSNGIEEESSQEKYEEDDNLDISECISPVDYLTKKKATNSLPKEISQKKEILDKPIIKNSKKVEEKKNEVIVEERKEKIIENNANKNGIPVPPPLDQKYFFTKSENKEENKEKKVLTMQEEIGENPIERLKKIGSIQINQIKSKEKPVQNSMMELLKQQIRIRFQNLKKHQEESDDDDDSDN